MFNRDAVWVLAGAVVGGLAAYGRLPGVWHTTQALFEVAVTVTASGVGWLVRQLSQPPDELSAAIGLVSLATPGVACVLLAAAVRLGPAAKTAAQMLLLAAAVGGWFVLDRWWHAALLTVLCVVLGGLLVKAASAAVIVGLAAACAATAVAGLQAVFVDGEYSNRQAAEQVMQTLNDDPVLYVPVLAGVSAGGFVVAVAWLTVDALGTASADGVGR